MKIAIKQKNGYQLSLIGPKFVFPRLTKSYLDLINTNMCMLQAYLFDKQEQYTSNIGSEQLWSDYITDKSVQFWSDISIYPDTGCD